MSAQINSEIDRSLTVRLNTFAQLQDQFRVLKWENAVIIRKRPIKAIPILVDIFASLGKVSDEGSRLSPAITLKAMDLLSYYYFHFLVSMEASAKDHYYQLYVSLLCEIVRAGSSMADLDLSKQTAMQKKKQTDLFLKKLEGLRDDVPGVLRYADISRHYEQFRLDHTIYGEQVPVILSSILRCWPVQFY